MRRTPGPVLVDVSSLVVSRRKEAASETARTERLVWRDRAGRGAWSTMDGAYLMALFAIVGLNLLDITITLIHTSAVGWEAEGNLLIRFIAETGGVLVAVGFKLALVAVALATMWYLFRRTSHSIAVARDRKARNRVVGVQRVIAAGTLLLVAFYVWVVQHNIQVVWG